MRARLILRRVTLAITTVFWSVPFAGTAFAQQIAQEDDRPYQPAITQVDPPSWLDPLGPLATLPVWAIAAVLAAVAAALVIVVPAAIRWAWTISATRSSRT